MSNPFKLNRTEYAQQNVHKDLIKAIKTIQKKLQMESDLRFGKKKYRISFVYASKVLGGFHK